MLSAINLSLDSDTNAGKDYSMLLHIVEMKKHTCLILESGKNPRGGVKQLVCDIIFRMFINKDLIFVNIQS